MSSDEIKNLRRKLKKARDSGKLQEISDASCNLAAYLSDEEDHEEALKLYKESLTCCEKIGNKVGAALAHRMITEESINLGYFEQALEHVSVFLKYAQDEGDKVEEQRGFVLKGHVYFTQAEYLIDAKPEESKKIEELLDLSMQAYRKSFAICNTELVDVSERERLQMKARLLQNKSLVLSRQNKLDYAQAHLVRAIKICTKEKLNDTEHICYLSLGDLYLKKGEPQKALNVYDRALELAHSTQKKRDSLIGKAKTYIAMENLQQAKAVVKKAYRLRADDEIVKLLKNIASVIRLENNLCSTSDEKQILRKDLYKKLGDSYCNLKHYKMSIKCYLNMLGRAQKAELSKNDLIKCYALLCKAFTNDKQYDKALFYSHQEVESLSKWAPEKAFKTYLRIAKLHELNNSEFEEVLFAYSKAKTKAQEFQNFKLQIKCLKKLINIGKTFNKPDLVSESKKELSELRNGKDSLSSCESESESESDCTDSENNSEQSSDVDIKDLISDSDVENEEYDRPKERCRRTKFTIKRNEKGETDLHVAAIKGNYKKVKHLIDQGHPVNIRDTAGWTPLHEACNHGYVDIVNILLDFGANINDKGGPSCDGTTPLHDAAINGQLEVIDTLIKRGASTLVLNDASETPLQCLLAWKKNSALDADEDAMFQAIVESLKSPLDSEDIRRHIKPTKSCLEKKPKAKKNELDIDDRRLTSRKTPVSDYIETIELLRGKRNSRDCHSGNSDDDDDEEGNGYKNSFGSLRKKPKSACEEYKEAMEELRFKPKKTGGGLGKAKPKPALIHENEYVDNCIMENDDVEDEEVDEENIKENVKEEKRKSPITKTKPCLEKEFKSKPWLKSIPMDLLEDSFELPVKAKEDQDIVKSDPVDNHTITVKIFSEKIQIFVKQSDFDKLKISWLIQEITKKYPTHNSPDNYIYIQIKGRPLGELDPLTLLRDEEVECAVTKWKALPLPVRYEKVCLITSHPDISSEMRASGFKHTVHPQVCEMLQKSSKTRTVTLSNLKLSSLTLIPICKALKYETFLQSLDLSNNYFGDKGIELIVKIFQKCIIEELDVSGCNITSTGVYHFSDALSGMNELSKNGLEVLNLRNNPITEDAKAAVNSIIEQLPNLRRLNIDCCELDTLVSVNNSSGLVVIQGNKFERPRRMSGLDS